MPLLTPLLATTTLLALNLHVVADTTPDWTDGASTFPQYTSLTPDGDFVVFSDRGDLWSAPINGGTATRLTTHPANDLASAISPDGSLLAFESGRHGSANLFVMPIRTEDGRLLSDGAIRRVTPSDRTQTLAGFSTDGRDLLFSSTHEPTIYRAPRLYATAVEGGPVRRLTDAQGREPRMHPDGRTLTFTRGFAPWARPAYRGSGNRDVWALDLPTGDFRRITDAPSNEGQTFGRPDGSMVLVSSRDEQNNIWLIPKNATLHNAKQLTHFAPSTDDATIGHGVRDLSVSADGATATFVVWNTLYALDLNRHKATPQPIQIRHAGDSATLEERRTSLDRVVNEAVLHPSGKAIAVVARGEVLVRSTDEEYPARRITDDHARQGAVSWSPDGSRLYYTTDETGRETIRHATVTLHRGDLKPETDEDESDDDTTEASAEDAPKTKPTARPRRLPRVKGDDAGTDDPKADEPEDKDTKEDEKKEDTPKKKPAKNDTGKHWSTALRFETAPVVSGEFDARRPQPSPNGRFLLYTRDRGDLVLHHLASGKDRVLLESWNEPDVQWLPDSRHLVYSVEDLDFNSDVWLMDIEASEDAVNLTRHPDIDHQPRISDDGTFLVFLSDRGRIGHNYEFDVYGMALNPSLLDMTKWAYDDHVAAAGKAAGAKKLLPVKTEGSPPAKGKQVDPLTFTDLDTAWRRVHRISSLDDSEGDLYLTPDGKNVLYSGNVDGTKALWSTDWKGSGRKQIVSGSVSNLQGLANGKQLAYISSGQAKTIAPSGGSAKTRSIDVDTYINVAAEQRQKFNETARLFGRDFYHPTLKGLDWPTLTERYGNLAASTRTSQAFNRVVNEFFGEVNGSHTGAYGGFSTGASSRTSIGYLAVETKPVKGGYEVTRVIADGPADSTDGLTGGDVLLAVNDAPLASSTDQLPQQDLAAALRNTASKETLLQVRSAEGETRLVLLTPTSYTRWRNLAYDDEITRRRETVEATSDGRLGYLHIRGMNMPSVHDFEHDLYAAAHGKDGLLIDVRDNGGGFTTDILLTSLTAPVHAFTVPRGADVSKVTPDTYPRDRRLLYAYSRPIAVLCNENSFSNAEIFSHAIKTAERGQLIGTETFGGVISTGSFTLIDGTTIRRPFRGWYLPDGTDMESAGAVPDVIVERTPADEVAGVDAQLQAAVTRLLRDLPSSTPTADPKPAT